MPHLVDTHVGKRIRQRRWQMGMTQENLAETTGVKFQQIQKYETGANRVSASRLWEIAGTLGVNISYFFEGMDPETAKGTDQEVAEFMTSKEAAELISAYYRLPEKHRRQLFKLAKVLAA